MRITHYAEGCRAAERQAKAATAPPHFNTNTQWRGVEGAVGGGGEGAGALCPRD